MSSAGVGPLCFLKSTVNAAIYQEILEHFMLPSADKLYGDADFIFQQDLAPAHTAKGTKSWFNDHGVTVLDWPANSPDLNPIEQWFSNLSCKHPCPAHFVCLPYQTHLIQLISSLVETARPELGVFDKGDIQNMQGRGACRTGLKTTAIENLWGIVKRKMRDTRPNNADDLKATVKETWASIPPQQCHKLITSMPRRIEAVIKAKGAPTKYWVHIQ